MTIAINTLFTTPTVNSILSAGLAIAKAVGLPTTSWRDDDPALALLHFGAETLGLREEIATVFIQSGFLSSATGEWLKLLAYEVYGVEVPDATYAEPTVTLTNSGGAYHEFEAGSAVFKSTANGKTYHNTEKIELAAGATDTFELVADEAGSESSCGVDDINEFITTMLGVVIDSSTAGVGEDEQSEASTRAQCRASLGSLSPNGPPDAYEYVCKNSALTGVSDITDAQSVENSTTGRVTVYVAGSSGPVASTSVTAAQTAVNTWARPLCITPTVVNSTAQAQVLTATITGTGVPADFEDQVETAYGVLLADINIGGKLALSALYRMIQQLALDNNVEDPDIEITVPSVSVTAATGAKLTADTVTVT